MSWSDRKKRGERKPLSPSYATARLTLAGLMMASGLLLPYLTAHAFGIPGTVLLPMHLPVLLCGFFCGPLYGAAVGLLTPLLSAVLTGMPAFYPMLPAMMAELFAYGLLSGLLYYRTPLGRWRYGAYPSLLLAMLGGRVMHGLAFEVMILLGGDLKSALAAVIGAVTVGLPGILVQLVLIPVLLLAVERHLPWRHTAHCPAYAAARRAIRRGEASCIVLLHRKELYRENRAGIGPALEALEAGALQDSVVLDRIVGRAAALLFLLGGVRRVYGKVMSRDALTLLREAGVRTDYGKCVRGIINRAGTGPCPMEAAVDGVTDPAEAARRIRETLAALREASRKESE